MLLEGQIRAFRQRHERLAAALESGRLDQEQATQLNQLVRQSNSIVNNRIVIALYLARYFEERDKTSFAKACDVIKEFISKSFTQCDGSRQTLDHVGRDMDFILNFVEGIPQARNIFQSKIEKERLAANSSSNHINRQLPVPVSSRSEDAGGFKFISKIKSMEHEDAKRKRRTSPVLYAFNDSGKVVHYTADVVQMLVHKDGDRRQEAARTAAPEFIQN